MFLRAWSPRFERAITTFLKLVKHFLLDFLVYYPRKKKKHKSIRSKIQYYMIPEKLFTQISPKAPMSKFIRDHTT